MPLSRASTRGRYSRIVGVTYTEQEKEEELVWEFDEDSQQYYVSFPDDQ